MDPYVDRQYAERLGRATFAVNNLEWMAIDVIRRLDAKAPITKLAGQTCRQLAEKLVAVIKRSSDLTDDQQTALADLAGQFLMLADDRDAVAHARPATSPEGRAMLYRWAPSKGASGSPRWIDNEVLDALTTDATRLNRDLGYCRAWLPPQASEDRS